MLFKLNTETTCFRKGVSFHSKPVVASAPIDEFIISDYKMDHVLATKNTVHFSKSNIINFLSHSLEIKCLGKLIV